MVISTVASRPIAVAEALEYCSKAISLEIRRPTLAETVSRFNKADRDEVAHDKRPEKIVPIMDADLVSGRSTFQQDLAGAVRACVPRFRLYQGFNRCASNGVEVGNHT